MASQGPFLKLGRENTDDWILRIDLLVFDHAAALVEIYRFLLIINYSCSRICCHLAEVC